MLGQLFPADLAELVLGDEVATHVLLDKLSSLEFDFLDDAEQIICIPLRPPPLNPHSRFISHQFPLLESVSGKVLSRKGL